MSTNSDRETALPGAEWIERMARRLEAGDVSGALRLIAVDQINAKASKFVGSAGPSMYWRDRLMGRSV